MKKIFCLLLAMLMICICLVGCGNNDTDIIKEDIEKVEDIIDNIEEDVDDEESEEVLIDFENFYFEIKGIKFEKFETFGSYLDLNPTPWDGHSVEDVLSLEECNFKVEDNGKYNDFSASFYNDGTDKADRDVIVSEMYIYDDSENPLAISFAQGVKFGDKVEDVLKVYGKPYQKYEEDGRVYSLEYLPDRDWIELEFEFNKEGTLSGFRVRYDYDDYLEMLEDKKD